MSLILNPAQAEAVYSAMCALNNVGAVITGLVFHGNIVVGQTTAGTYVYDGRMTTENYADQHAFAITYGLQTGA